MKHGLPIKRNREIKKKKIENIKKEAWANTPPSQRAP
jgi:hypothetical protein